MALVNIKIEGFPYLVDDSLTVLQACRKCGYNIPSLCSFKNGKCSVASCRVCLVAVEGVQELVASCVYPVHDGISIRISDPDEQVSNYYFPTTTETVRNVTKTAIANCWKWPIWLWPDRIFTAEVKRLQPMIKLLRRSSAIHPNVFCAAVVSRHVRMRRESEF